MRSASTRRLPDFAISPSREPQPWLNWWVYRPMALRVGQNVSANAHDRDEHLLLIKQYVLRHERNVEKMRREVEARENCRSLQGSVREPIPKHVRLFVWRRDKGPRASVSGAVPAWSSITSSRSSLVAATRNRTSNFCASRVTERRVQRYDRYL